MTMAERPPVIVTPTLSSLCRYDPAGDYGTHRAYHHGEPCPFQVCADVLAGRPDIRDSAVEWIIPIAMSTGQGAGLKPPITLNDRRNHFAHAAKVKMVRNRTRNEVREANIPTLEHIRVELHLRPQTNAVRDRDNLVATLKPCIDALTPDQLEKWAGIVPGDDPRFVSWVPPIIHRAVKGRPAEMWLVLTAYPSEVTP